MKEAVAMKRLMIFIDETNKWHGKSLSAALVDRLNKEGCSGATVLRGTAGFGSHHRVHTSTIMDLSSALPEIVLVIETAEKMDSILPIVEAMVEEGLLVLDDVHTIKLSKS